MPQTPDFHKHIIDSVTDHICVIDRAGWIVFTNKAWRDFAEQNGAAANCDFSQVNYLQVCAGAEDDAGEACEGIRKVISGELECFSYEYPCHSPTKSRWFMMRVTPLQRDEHDHFVISHQDITQRKLAEDRALKLARIDVLTGLANRRYFDDFLMNEWRRCARQKRSLSLAFIDIDYFKQVNDNYGHAVGDDCLERIATVLEHLAHRPGDCCARYGGDEFALLLSDTSLEVAEKLLGNLPDTIRGLRIPNRNAPTGPHVTASIGLTAMQPMPDTDESMLLRAADQFLYQAKSLGRNQMCSGPFPTATDIEQRPGDKSHFTAH